MTQVKVVVNFEYQPSYDVVIGEGLIPQVGARIKELLPLVRTVAVISDTNVAPLYYQSLYEGLAAEHYKVVHISIPAGEASKNPECLTEVWRACAQAGLDRDSALIALGGGVVGDLAGFAAATYMRGIPYVQVPTTLLAMVDSSVGGKTAIDLPEGKNLAGVFKQPAAVWADTDALSTLDAREWACGLGEVAKTAVLDSDEFFFWLNDHASEMSKRDISVVRDAIVRCVVYKANVVARDEQERSGERAWLNYGHTLGHALESCTGYGILSHGACVAEGMRFASRLGAALVGTPLELIQAQDTLLDALKLFELDFASDQNSREAPVLPSIDELIESMRSDKKNSGGKIRFILPRDVGAFELQSPDEELLREHVSAWVSSKR